TFKGAWLEHTSVVHENVETATVVDDLLERCLNIFGLADVSQEPAHRGVFLARRLESLGATHEAEGGGTLLREHFCGGFTDARVGAGNQDGLAFEVLHAAQ